MFMALIVARTSVVKHRLHASNNIPCFTINISAPHHCQPISKFIGQPTFRLATDHDSSSSCSLGTVLCLEITHERILLLSANNTNKEVTCIFSFPYVFITTVLPLHHDNITKYSGFHLHFLLDSGNKYSFCHVQSRH